MTSRKIRVGIIGAGQIGKHHMHCYKELPGIEMAAVADLNADEARRVAKEYNISRVFGDFHDLLACGDIEAVDVCLHNNLHMPVTVAALMAGKHVFCEKPMAGTYRDACTMYETARKARRLLHIQLSTLFSDETKAAKILIDEGRLGEIYHARSTGFRRRGRPFVDGYGSAQFVDKNVAAGGALYDMGVYHIANLLYLMGNPEVVRIAGKTYQKTAIHPVRRKMCNYTVEELGLGFVTFQGGVTMDIIEAWAIHLDGLEGSCIVGSEGGIRLSPFGFFQNLGDMEMNSTVNLPLARRRWNMLLGANEDAYVDNQPHWMAALQGRVKLLPTAAIALNTMLISEGIYLSNRLDREVTAAEIKKASKSTALKV